MTAYTFDENIVSDLHKDTYGFRPREYFWSEWNNSSNDEKQKIWDDLCADLEREIVEEKERDKLAVAAFEARVENVIATGAGNRETALRWILQGMGLDENDLMYGGDKVCYDLGLPYAMRHEFDPICKILLKNMETTE